MILAVPDPNPVQGLLVFGGLLLALFGGILLLPRLLGRLSAARSRTHPRVHVPVDDVAAHDVTADAVVDEDDDAAEDVETTGGVLEIVPGSPRARRRLGPVKPPSTPAAVAYVVGMLVVVFGSMLGIGALAQVVAADPHQAYLLTRGLGLWPVGVLLLGTVYFWDATEDRLSLGVQHLWVMSQVTATVSAITYAFFDYRGEVFGGAPGGNVSVLDRVVSDPHLSASVAHGLFVAGWITLPFAVATALAAFTGPREPDGTRPNTPLLVAITAAWVVLVVVFLLGARSG